MSFQSSERSCPMVLPVAPTSSAASRSARIPSFSGTWPSTVSPALSSPPKMIFPSSSSSPMYLNPTGVS